MAPTSRSTGARAESVPVSRPPSTPRPRLIPYVEIPVFRGGLASRGSTPSSRASSVVSNGRSTLKRKELEAGSEELPLAKRLRKPRVPGPPMSLAERAQSARPSLSFLRSTPRRSVASESQPSFKVPHLPAKVLRPPRRNSSPTLPETVSAPPAIEILSDGSGSGPPSVEGEQSEPYVDPASQPRSPPLNQPSPSASQAVETVAEEPGSTQVTQEGSSAAARPRRGRPRTLPRDAQGNYVTPVATRKTRSGGQTSNQVIKRRPGRPRLDGRELVTVIQDGVESKVRSRDLKRLSKRPRRVQTPDEESNWEEEEEELEDGYQPRAPTSRFKMPEPPVPISRGPPDRVPQDVMAAYASHAALLQSHTEAGLPQLYAAFQTFWIPRRANYFVLMGGTGSGLPYQALTSQGGGPGSSTAVHLSNPSFFYWDPLPLVPGGIRCPAAACSNLLQQAGLVKQPKKVYIEGNTAVSSDPYVGFWIIAARYKCQKCGVRGTANPKVYSSYVAWDQRILENLPPLIRSEFPAVEKKKNGKKAFYAAEVALPAEHRMDPQFVSAMIPIQEPQPQVGPSSAAVSGPNGPSETAHQLHPSGSVAPVNTGPIDQPDLPSLSSPPQIPSPSQLSVQIQPPASGLREEEGEAAERLFAELLFDVTQPHAEESENAQVQADAGTSLVAGPGNGPDQVLGTIAAEPLDIAFPVPESHDAPLPAGSSTAGQSAQAQDANVDLIGGEALSTTDVGISASSSGHPSGGSSSSGHQLQSHADIPQPYYPLVGTSSSSAPPLEPSPSQSSSSSSTPPGPSTSTAQIPVLSASAVMHPYFAQFKAPTPQVTAPPPIVFFNPFITPGGSSAPASTVAPSVPSWPLSLSSSQPGPSSSTVSSYPALTGAIMPSHDANPVQVPGLPIPIIGSYDSQSQVQVQVKKRRGPRKCSKCLQTGCKGANGVQYCPNPCFGCKQVDCKKPHTMRGNLCVESGSRSDTGPGELVPLEPSPSNSDSANGNGEAGQGDVHMHDAEGELEHELDRSVDVGPNGLVE